MTRKTSYLATAAALAVFGLGVAPAFAQSGAEFFNGKTVNYIVATDPGGGYDTNGRLVAQFMQKHLPGSTFVVRNMPGAGHLIATNYIFASEPDGLTLGTFNTGLIYAQLVADQGVKFDLTEMSWIGKVASDPRVLLVSKDAGIGGLEDLQNSETRLKFAAAGVGSASTVESTLLISSLNLPIDLITGYDGNDGLLAMRRGEVQGTLGARSSLEPFVAEGHGYFLAQIGGSTIDVPQLSSMVSDPLALQAIALVESQGNISRLTAAPPGVPEDRLQALRDAYTAAVSDPEFLERAVALGLPIDPLIGEDVGVAVAKALDQTPEVIEYLKSSLEED